jgi:hypothetical protein
LNGKRELNIRQVKALSERFHVPSSVFLWKTVQMSVRYRLRVPQNKIMDERQPNHKMHLTGGIQPVNLNYRHPGVGSDPDGDPEPAPGK